MDRLRVDGTASTCCNNRSLTTVQGDTRKDILSNHARVCSIGRLLVPDLLRFVFVNLAAFSECFRIHFEMRNA